MTARLVYYGLSVGPGERARRLVGQLLRSVTSLRAHNRRVPVRIFLFGELESGARAELDALDATIVEAGDHEAHLRRFCSPAMTELLARYPVLHNITCLPMLADEPARQILYVDADTHFFRDVEALFDRATELDIYAREIPGSPRSPHGRDREAFNAELFAEVAAREGARVVTPFNTGVTLFNHGSWRTIGARVGEVLRDVFRFSVWLSRGASRRETEDIRYLRQHRQRMVSAEDEAAALPYPSDGPWIRDEIAVALAAGRTPHLRIGYFSRHDVVQGDEFQDLRFAWQVLAHYFSVHTDAFAAWLDSARAACAPALGEPARGQEDVGRVFELLGDAIDSAWQEVDRDEEAFAGIVAKLVTEARLTERLSHLDVARWALTAPLLPAQEDLSAQFGSPPITVYNRSRFHIQVVFWRDGATSVHGHSFRGAFLVLEGASLHARCSFLSERRIHSGLFVGSLKLESAELLTPGNLREISGDLIHSIHHLGSPCTSVIIRTHGEEELLPQLDYAPPGVAFEREHADDDTVRKAQILQFLLRKREPGWQPIAEELIARSSPSIAWDLLWRAADATARWSEIASLIEVARRSHGAAFEELADALHERVRRHEVYRLREQTKEPNGRFLLALAGSLPDRESIFAVIRGRHPHEDPRELAMGWMESISGVERIGVDLSNDLNHGVVRAMLDGCSAQEIRARLAETFDADELRAQADVIDKHARRIRSTLLAPLLKEPDSAAPWPASPRPRR